MHFFAFVISMNKPGYLAIYVLARLASLYQYIKSE